MSPRDAFAPGSTVRVHSPRRPFPTGRKVHGRRGVVLGPPSAASTRRRAALEPIGGVP